MSEKSYLQLKTTSILNVPFETYDVFTFIVNGKEFQTNRLISDLLSPKICLVHSIDPTIDHFSINTKNEGDFKHILELANFQRNEISNDEALFICEILDAFGNDSIEFFNSSEKKNLTIENSLKILKKHQLFPSFYGKNISEDIEFISSNFGEMIEKKKEDMKKVDVEIIERILSSKNLRIHDEDQLLKFINELYNENSSYFTLYEFVLFTNVSSEIMGEFIEIYNVSDITNETWKSLSLRLKQNVTKNNDDEHKKRYSVKCIDLKFESNKEFEGIIHHFLKETNGKIENELKITSSSNSFAAGKLDDVINYNNKSHFRMKGGPNSWICFYFKNHRVNVTHYTLKSGTNGENEENPKSWVIEGSNDNSKWDILDEKRNNSILNGKNLVHTFEIEKQKQKEYKYIRMKQTDKNWYNNDDLMLSAFEIHGKLY